MPASELASIIMRLVDSDKNCSVLTVDGVGYHCSRCLYMKHCCGCPVPSEGEVVLRSADTLAIRFMESFKESQAIQNSRMQERRSLEPLSLYDCLKAFSESELLDEHNAWYCPTCQKNQCATYKEAVSLLLSRFPYSLFKKIFFSQWHEYKIRPQINIPC